MKKKLSVILAITLLVSAALAAAGCGSQDAYESTAKGNAVKKIGIVQIVEHPSLNTIRESIIKELEAGGYKDGKNVEIDYQNAQNDMTNLKTIVQKFTRNKDDLIIAIATPSAQAAMNETDEIPIIFSACTDPVDTGIVPNLDKPGGNVTGTSDAVSAEKIMQLAEQLTPGIKTVGALYSLSEANSVSVIEDLKAYAKEKGMAVIDATVTTTADVQQAVNSLVGKVDAIFSPIDNTVASAMPVVAEASREAGIPVYVGADSMVKDGGLATYGVNYETLGQETAKMAVEVLEGKNPGDMPVKLMSDVNIYVNSDTAEQLGIDIPEDILSKATVFTDD